MQYKSLMSLRATYCAIFIAALTISYIQGEVCKEVVGGTMIALGAATVGNSYDLFD